MLVLAAFSVCLSFLLMFLWLILFLIYNQRLPLATPERAVLRQSVQRRGNDATVRVHRLLRLPAVLTCTAADGDQQVDISGGLTVER